MPAAAAAASGCIIISQCVVSLLLSVYPAVYPLIWQHINHIGKLLLAHTYIHHYRILSQNYVKQMRGNASTWKSTKSLPEGLPTPTFWTLGGRKMSQSWIRILIKFWSDAFLSGSKPV
jgi:hypothetical protein